ncbi:MAG: hypothetical protein ACP5MV_00830 [Candidatus Parvarchaeum sp.]
MEHNLMKIILDMGELPVKDKDKLDIVELSEFPGQFMFTKKGHRRSLEVDVLRDYTKENTLFIMNCNFAYFKPIVNNDEIEDYVTAQYKFADSNNKIVAGRLKNKAGRTARVIYPGISLPIEFYSLDSEMNLHKAEISLKYKTRKDLLEITLNYDNDVKLKFDTNGNYSLNDISKKSLFKSKEIKSGNLLSEEDNTLYFDRPVPAKLYSKYR